MSAAASQAGRPAPVAGRRTRSLLRLLAINVTVTVAYRGNFFLMQLANLVTPLVSLLVWHAALVSGAQLPVKSNYLTTYFVLVAIVRMLTSSWTAAFLAESIRLGELARWLVRPASTHWEYVANNVGEKVVKLALVLPVVVTLVVVLRGQMRLPADGGRWLLFGVSLLMAAVLVFALDVLVGATAFWFDEVSGFDRARRLIVGVLSGVVVPLALMPGWAAGVVAVQPFRFTVSFPLEVLLGSGGSVGGQSLAVGFGWQAGWTAVFVGAAALVWRLGLRSYSAAGA